MSLYSTLSTLLRTGLPYLQKHLSIVSYCSKKAYHSFSSGKSSIFAERTLTNGLLVPKPLCLLSERGMKFKSRLKRRCKDCYFVMRDHRMYVMCKTHPRHKQAMIQKKEKYMWVLSHATQSRIRPW